MNHSQISAFQYSLTQIAPDADHVADLFYARLFHLDPALRGFFPNDLRPQKMKLLRLLALVGRDLDKPHVLAPILEQLGRRHARFGVQARHYETFGAALLWTLETDLGEDFTPEMRGAWIAVYDLLSKSMLQGERGSILETLSHPMGQVPKIEIVQIPTSARDLESATG